jgi:alkylation response protein AidB-like acyl-CoA dehydrogenase
VAVVDAPSPTPTRLTSAELGDLLAAIRAFVEREVLPLEHEHREVLATDAVTDEFFSLCRRVQERSVAAGFHAMFAPVDFGGAALGDYAMCRLREQVAAFPCRLTLLMLGDLPFGPNEMLISLADTWQRDRYVLPLVLGEKTTGIAITEPHAGSDFSALRTTAHPTKDGWVLSGTKHFITNAPFADFLQVVARDDQNGGLSMFLVDRESYQVARRQVSMCGEDIQAEVVFDDGIVPNQNLLGQPGAALEYVVQFLSKERLSMAAMALGVAELALGLAKDYARARTAFGKPIFENQAIQWMVADSETELFAARTMCYEVARRSDDGKDIFRESSMAKLYATEMVGRVVDRAVQIFGGAGYMRDGPVERLYRLVRVMRIAGGSSEIQRMIIARMSV